MFQQHFRRIALIFEPIVFRNFVCSDDEIAITDLYLIAAHWNGNRVVRSLPSVFNELMSQIVFKVSDSQQRKVIINSISVTFEADFNQRAARG